MREINLIKLYSHKRYFFIGEIPDARVAISMMLRTFGVTQFANILMNIDHGMTLLQMEQ